LFKFSRFQHLSTTLAEVVRLQRVVTKALQRYWRLSRGLTLGAQGCVIDSHNRVLLIRHTYRPGWFFPGGGVEKAETVEESLARELWEEAGVRIGRAAPQLFGLYANHKRYPGDHIALFVVRDWEQPVPPRPNREIAAHQFVDPADLPADIHPPTAARIAEIFAGTPRSQVW
jgi:8-oxo-dGTP pyrophosphatase MutT (NUDIX family)